MVVGSRKSRELCVRATMVPTSGWSRRSFNQTLQPGLDMFVHRSPRSFRIRSMTETVWHVTVHGHLWVKTSRLLYFMWSFSWWRSEGRSLVHWLFWLQMSSSAPWISWRVKNLGLVFRLYLVSRVDWSESSSTLDTRCVWTSSTHYVQCSICFSYQWHSLWTVWDPLDYGNLFLCCLKTKHTNN